MAVVGKNGPRSNGMALQPILLKLVSKISSFEGINPREPRLLSA